MSTLISARTLLAVACSFSLLAACGDSGDRNNNTSRKKPKKDTGVMANADAGDMMTNQPDAGTMGCTPSCAPNQRYDANCICLAECNAPYTWNAASQSCVMGGGNDGGTQGTPDSGTQGTPDSGTMSTPDAGMMQGGCMSNNDCPGTGGTCVLIPQDAPIELCNSRSGCQCVTSCNPYVPGNQSGCNAASEGCFWLGSDGVIPGACVPDPTPTQGTQNAPCTAMFDAQGNLTGSQGCNRNQNYFCLGASPDAPTGRCGRICHPQMTDVCTSLGGNYRCDALDAMNNLGLCLQPQNFSDIGQACMADTECMSQSCLQGLGCTASCGGLLSCPADSVCLAVNGGSCFRECTSDSQCSGLNPNNICQQLGMAPNTINVCFPRCTMDSDCGMNGMCNTQTGHCTF